MHFPVKVQGHRRLGIKVGWATTPPPPPPVPGPMRISAVTAGYVMHCFGDDISADLCVCVLCLLLCYHGEPIHIVGEDTLCSSEYFQASSSIQCRLQCFVLFSGMTHSAVE